MQLEGPFSSSAWREDVSRWFENGGALYIKKTTDKPNQLSEAPKLIFDQVGVL